MAISGELEKKIKILPIDLNILGSDQMKKL